MAETSYLVMQIHFYILYPLSLILTFLAFEGLRRKNLEKILTSIKLMKIHLVAQFIVDSLTTIARHFEGTLSERYQKMGPAVDIENQWMLLFFFLITGGCVINMLRFYLFHFAGPRYFESSSKSKAHFIKIKAKRLLIYLSYASSASYVSCSLCIIRKLLDKILIYNFNLRDLIYLVGSFRQGFKGFLLA